MVARRPIGFAKTVWIAVSSAVTRMIVALSRSFAEHRRLDWQP